MPTCTTHPRDLYGHTDMKEVAEAIGNLHYEVLAELFVHIAEKMYKDGTKDFDAGRVQLGNNLLSVANKLAIATTDILRAWEICKPHMK